MKRDLRDAVFPVLHDLMRQDSSMVILHNDLGAFGLDDIKREYPSRAINVGVAEQKWPTGQRRVTVEQIQEVVEHTYGIDHDGLVGGRRNKELMEPRHVAIFLTRELTDNTLADIGKHFGNRTHATVKHSIHVVEQGMRDDRVLQDRIARIRDAVLE